jgi:alkyl hydroperoxide reductase subunit AhpC
MPKYWAFPSTADGVTWLFRQIANCIFRCWPISNPKDAVARAYGAYDEKEGECLRALFVLDEQHIIQWSYLSPTGINPGADGILDALEALTQPVKS